MNNSGGRGLFTSRGCCRRRCEERNDSGNLMPLRMNMRSPRFARDDNFHKEKCRQICTPEGEKIPTEDEIVFIKKDLNKGSADFMNNAG